MGMQASNRCEQGRRKSEIWIQKEQSNQALNSKWKGIEMKVSVIIITTQELKKDGI